jgi:hypothetical protein
MKKIMNLKKVNGSEKIVLNLKNGKGKWVDIESGRIENFKAEVIYDRYSRKILKVKMAA